mgnify:FL=1|jgi:hypothetical protein|tara:strand:- start:555 stop:977 length:423 start_codon:yes stop_codon:yes gene_type:complete
MKNIWDWLKQINSIKADPNSFSDKDWELWNSYMIHRFMSMNINFLDIVNEVQTIPPQNKKEIYTIYREFIPKNNKWNKYIKSSVKQPNKDLIDKLSSIWECSKSEAKTYVNILESDKLIHILTRVGIDKKESNKLIKLVK